MKKSITIHNIDSQTAKLIEDLAKAEGRSLNKTIQALLEEALGVKPRKAAHLADFSEFLGRWKASDIQRFQRATKDLRKIEDEDWR